jgi:hypothetical protein
MARYTCRFSIPLNLEKIHKPLRDLMLDCDMEIIYEIEDYLMGREIPGQVAFAKLATTEILIDTTVATETSVGIQVVVKNEELPLKVNNHCQQIFNSLQEKIADRYPDWQLLIEEEDTASAPTAN